LSDVHSKQQLTDWNQTIGARNCSGGTCTRNRRKASITRDAR